MDVKDAGRKGGKARAAKLSAKQLSKIGRQGARARWDRRHQPKRKRIK